ncbi:putative F-box/FBD/LRR-repeat protein isoform X1 [Capsicum annuum]|uniref:putative F-box/FBD/LRR-repeat protein At4g13965 isoform X1 n=1 Tax=Capsicum annuum TaxID=4072 RepID=UPI001FB14DA5|nr:putative F-box/FBD/LRR-repeat protein At4g13965 isoform X1 [Capsicum annuum]
MVGTPLTTCFNRILLCAILLQVKESILSITFFILVFGFWEIRHRTSLRVMKEQRVDEVEDQISKLPEPILNHFMGLLLAKDAARMSTLSKTWYAAWSSLPYLNFGDRFFYREVRGRWILSENIQELVHIVDQTLANRKKHKISVQKFWLKVPSSYRMSSSYVHNWIKILVTSNIKELILKVGESDSSFDSLPEELFVAEGLNILNLRGFKLELPLHHGIKFSSLRNLRLTDTYLDEKLVQDLCASCVCLEKLRLSCCRGLASLQIAASLLKLKTVWLCCLPELQIVDIAAPYLENVYIESQLWNLQVVKITCSKSLKTLYIVDVYVTDGWLKDLLVNQPKLECLSLSGCLKLQAIKISSDRLKYLALSWCLELIDVELETPNLTRFRCECDENLPTLKLMKASVFLVVELEFSLTNILDSHWYSVLMKFLGNFKQSKAIKLDCCDKNGIVIPNHMRENLVPPLYGTNANWHIIFNTFGDCSLMDILDSLLWISPQLDTLTFVRESNLNSTLKFIYEDASAEGEKFRWRHKLKKVKMENFTCMEQQELRNYLFTNEDYIGEEASVV